MGAFDIERMILYGTHLNKNTFLSSFNICLITGFSTFVLLYVCTIFAPLVLLQKTSCNCDNSNQRDKLLIDTESCDKDNKVICQQKMCVVYRRGKSNRN